MVKKGSTAFIFILGLLLGCCLTLVLSGRRSVVSPVFETTAKPPLAAQSPLLQAIAAVPEPLRSATNLEKLLAMPGDIEAAATAAEVDGSANADQIGAARGFAAALREDLNFQSRLQQLCLTPTHHFVVDDVCRRLLDAQLRRTPAESTPPSGSDHEFAEAVIAAANRAVSRARTAALDSFRRGD